MGGVTQGQRHREKFVRLLGSAKKPSELFYFQRMEAGDGSLGKVKAASKHAGVSPQTFRPWLKDGLVHSVLPSGTILVHRDAIDEYIKRYTVDGNEIDRITAEVMRDL